VGERGLAEPRRAGQEKVIERLPSPASGFDEKRQLPLELLLADEVLEPAGPERPVEFLLPGAGGRYLDAEVGGTGGAQRCLLPRQCGSAVENQARQGSSERGVLEEHASER
jgi:hypothetical protein